MRKGAKRCAWVECWELAVEPGGFPISPSQLLVGKGQNVPAAPSFCMSFSTLFAVGRRDGDDRSRGRRLQTECNHQANPGGMPRLSDWRSLDEMYISMDLDDRSATPTPEAAPRLGY